MMAIRRFAYRHGAEVLGCVECKNESVGANRTSKVAVFLHGGGTADKDRAIPLMEDFVAAGYRAGALDFTGHGESAGDLKTQSLQSRFGQAKGFIDAFTEDDDELLLVGFSMSGQTVADLLTCYSSRVTAIGLCAPAVYACEAWEAEFGLGFTSIIRKKGSWRSSRALHAFGDFRGRAVLARPDLDTVIPPEVTSHIREALARRSSFRELVFDQAGHQLGKWFAGSPPSRLMFVEALSTG